MPRTNDVLVGLAFVNVEAFPLSITHYSPYAYYPSASLAYRMIFISKISSRVCI